MSRLQRRGDLLEDRVDRIRSRHRSLEQIVPVDPEIFERRERRPIGGPLVVATEADPVIPGIHDDQILGRGFRSDQGCHDVGVRPPLRHVGPSGHRHRSGDRSGENKPGDFPRMGRRSGPCARVQGRSEDRQERDVVPRLRLQLGRRQRGQERCR